MLNMLLADTSDLVKLTDGLKGLINDALPYIITVLVSLVGVWAVFLGVKWWQAGTQEKQREAKQYLINFFIGIIVIFVVAVIVVALMGYFGTWSSDTSGTF